MARVPVSQVGFALPLYDIFRNLQADASVDGSSALRMFGIVVERYDFVAEKSSRTRTGVRDSGLFLRHFQFEVIAKELSQLLLDLFGFASWSRESKEEVVGVTHVLKASVIRVGGVRGRHLLGDGE